MKNNRIKFKQTKKREELCLTWHEPRKHQRCRHVHFLLVTYCWAYSLPLKVVCFPSATHWGKWLSIGDCFRVREGGTCPLFLSAVGLRLLQLTCVGQMHAACLWVHFCFAQADLEGLVLLGVLHPLWLLHSFHLPSSAGFHEPRGEGSDSSIPFRAEGSRVPHSLHTECLAVGLCISSHLLQEEASPMSKTLIYECSWMPLEVIFLCIFLRTVIFGFILGLVSGSWSPKQCWVRVPSHGLSLQSNQVLAGCSHKLCAPIALVYLATRTLLFI